MKGFGDFSPIDPGRPCPYDRVPSSYESYCEEVNDRHTVAFSKAIDSNEEDDLDEIFLFPISTLISELETMEEDPA